MAVFRQKKRCKVAKTTPFSPLITQKHPSDYECTNQCTEQNKLCKSPKCLTLMVCQLVIPSSEYDMGPDSDPQSLLKLFLSLP